MSVLDFAAQSRTSSPLLALVDVEPLSAEDDAALDDELARSSGGVLLGRNLEEAAEDVDPLDGFRAELDAIVESYDGGRLEEGVYWDPERHPRWPANTPGGLGGKFMRVGQHFKLGDLEYEVSQIHPGKIYAHLATKGTSLEPKEVSFSADQLADFDADPEGVVQGKGVKLPVISGIERPPAAPIKSTKAGSFTSTNVTVVDPYVDPKTHDASIELPAGSDMKPEEWKRFGKQDQERYAQLMERFGQWQPGKAQQLVDKALAAGDAATRQMLESSYSSQFGSSTGFTISLHGIYKSLVEKVTGGPDVEKARSKFEAGRALQNEAAGVLQWDLYNRVHAPDLAIFHGHNTNSLFTNEVIKGNKPVFAGLSQSQWFRPGFFGSNKLATPMAIRHIVMATTAADIYKGHGFKNEWEVATADPFNADARTMNFPDGSGGGYGGEGSGTHGALTGMQQKWLSKITEHGGGGWILDTLRDSYKDGGGSLPVPPAPASIQIDGAGGGPSYTPPPADAVVGIGKLAYAEVDEQGHPISKRVKEMVEGGELQPGDYIEGMKGTRYIIVKDSADPYLGLAYYKVTDTGTKVVGTETKNVDTNQETSAFTTHNDWQGGVEVYQFEGGGKLAFKKLAGHYDLPELEEITGTGFHPEAWSETGPKQQKFIKDFAPTEKFKVAGTPYEVQSLLANGNAKIVKLDDGKTGQINGDYKTTWLVLKQGYTEQGTPQLTIGDFFPGAVTDVGSSFDSLTPGQAMLVGKTLYQVKEQTPDGHVKAIVAGATEGEAKLGAEKTFDATQKYQALTPKPPGWREPKIGDTLAIDGEKATLTKVRKDGTYQFKRQKGGVELLKPDDPRLANVFSPGDYELGDKEKLHKFAVGEKFHGGAGAAVRPYVVVDQKGKVTVVKSLDTGESLEMSGGKSFSHLYLKQSQGLQILDSHVVPVAPAALFDANAWEAGPEVKTSELAVGDKFTTASGTPFELSGDTVEGYPTLKPATNLTTGETTNLSMTYEGTVTKLHPKLAAPEPDDETASGFDPDAMPPNDDDLALGDLDAGDLFAAGTGAVYVVKGKGKPGKVVVEIVAKKIGATSLHPIGFTASFGADGVPPYVQKAGSLTEPLFVKDEWESAGGDLVPVENFKAGSVFAFYQSGDEAGPTAIWRMDSPDEKLATLLWTAGTEVSAFASTQMPVEGNARLWVKKEVPWTAGTFDPSAYVDGETAHTIEIAKPGVIFRAKSGDVFQVQSVENGQIKATVLAVKSNTGNAILGAVAPINNVATVTVLLPKATSPVPPEQLVPGDPILVGKLHEGDQFSLWPADADGIPFQVYQVITAKSDDDEQPHIVYAPVGANGALGMASTLPANNTVTLHAGSADKMPPLELDQVLATTPDPSAHPDAVAVGGLEPFKWHKAGSGITYAKIKSMPAGTVFKDKGGKTWKVKTSGVTAIVTDGQKLYKVDGDLRGHALEGADATAFKDSSAIVPTKLQDVEAIAAGQDLQTNTANGSLEGLKLSKGDVFNAKVPDDDGKWTVTQVTPDGWYSAYNAKTGKSKSFLGGTVPASYKKGETSGLFVDGPTVAKPDTMLPIPLALTTDPGDYDVLGNKSWQDLAPGDVVFAPDGQVTFVAAADPDKLWVQHPGDPAPVAMAKSLAGFADGTATLLKPKEDIAAPQLGVTQNVAGLSLGSLAPGTEFHAHLAHFASSGDAGVWQIAEKMSASKVKVTNAEGSVLTVSSGFVPDSFGPEGAYAAQAVTSTVASPNPEDYDEVGHGTLGALLPGDFFKSATGVVLRVVKKNDDGQTVTVENVATGSIIDNASTEMPMTRLVPKKGGGGGLGAGGLPPWTPVTSSTQTGILKSWADVEIGETVRVAAYGGAVFRVVKTNPDDESVFLEVVRPGNGGGYYGMKNEKGKKFTVKYGGGYGLATQQIYDVKPDTPIYDKGEIVKAVKPGNKNGKTARIDAVNGPNDYTIRYPDGKVVDHVTSEWFHPVKQTTYITLDKLKNHQVSVGRLDPGSIVELNSSVFRVGRKQPDSDKIRLFPLFISSMYGGYSEVTPQIKVELLATSEEVPGPPDVDVPSLAGHVAALEHGAPTPAKLIGLSDDGTPLVITATNGEPHPLVPAPSSIVGFDDVKPGDAVIGANGQLYEISDTPSTAYGHSVYLKGKNLTTGKAEQVYLGAKKDAKFVRVGSVTDDPELLTGDGTGAKIAPHILPSEAQVGDIIVGENGKKFVVSAIDKSPVSASVTLKGSDGVTGSGYYSDSSTSWMKVGHTDDVAGFGKGPEHEFVSVTTLVLQPMGQPLSTLPPGTEFTVEPETPLLGEYGDVVWKIVNGYAPGNTSLYVEPMSDIGVGGLGVSPETKATYYGPPGSLAAKGEPLKSKLASGLAGILGEKVPVGSMFVGEHFTLVAGGSTNWVVVGKKDGKVQAIHLEAGTMAATDLPASTEVTSVEPETVTKPLSSLATGTKFTTGALSEAPGGQVWVKGVADPGDEEKLYAKNVETGATDWFGKDLAVTPLPETVMTPTTSVPEPTPQPHVGGGVKAGQLAAGDFYYVEATGNTFKVLWDPTPRTDGKLDVQIELVKKGPQTGNPVGTQFLVPYDPDAYVGMFSNPPEEKAEQDVNAEVATAGGLSDVLEPYKWHKGGHGQKYDKIGTLAVGTSFADKTGNKYVVKNVEGGLVYYVPWEDWHGTAAAAAKTYATTAEKRVHVTFAP